ncbi:MAG: hypothetical protein GY859_24060 [Desulfobacterales bacterium]|nr:hypothetical protein [Desulfobacterales bacterium]
MNSRIVAASSLEDLPPEASSLRFLLERRMVRSIIFVPIFHGDIVKGAIGMDSTRKKREWGAEENLE